MGTNAKSRDVRYSAAFETCRRTLRMSVYRGRPEVIGAPSEWRDWPFSDIAGRYRPTALPVPRRHRAES